MLAPEAIGEVVDLLCSVPDPVEDHEVASVAGLLLWLRFAARGTMDGEAEMSIALDLFASLYRRGGRIPDLIREQFDRKPPAEPDGAKVLARFGSIQYVEALGNANDEGTLRRAVDLLRRAVAVAGSGHPDYARYLSTLGNALVTRFECVKAVADLKEGIELVRAAVAATRPDNPDRAMYLSNLGNALLTRAEHLASVADIDAAIEAGEAAVKGWPDHPDHAAMVNNLNLALRARSSVRDQVNGLDRMIEAARTEANAPGRPGAARLSDLLRARFDYAGDPADLDEAIRVCREALAAAVDDSTRAEHLSGLGALLQARFVHFGQMPDLIDAVAHGRAAVAATPPDDPEVAERQSSLANALCQRYQSSGSLRDLQDAATLGRSAVAATSADEVKRSAYLTSLCHTLRLLFERTGRLADIDEAVDAGRAAVDAGPQGSPHLSAFLGNFGAALLARYRYAGSQADVDRSVDVLRRAALAAPATSPERATVLSNLGGALQLRFHSVRRAQDLDEAIDACRAAVEATAPGHASRAGRLSNLAAALRTRFEHGGDMSDLDDAVEASRCAVEALAPGHRGRAAALSNYALVLRGRYTQAGRSAADLNAAVDAVRASVAETPTDHPDRPMYLVNLSQALRERRTLTGADADLDGALAAAREAASVDAGPPRLRAAAAALWGSLAATSGRWVDAVAGHAAAIEFVARAVPRHLTRRDKEFMLDGTGGIGSDAAACCVQAGSLAQAVELFEQGRGLLLSQALDSRTDLTALAERHPALADRFAMLRGHLDLPSPADDDNTMAARRATAEAFDQLIADIRARPGFDRFLRPPAVGDLAPNEGHAVIVSVSPFGSYALILSSDGKVTATPLPMLTPGTVLAEVQKFLQAVEETTADSARTRAAAQNQMTRTLGWLWDAIAGPVLDRLDIIGPPRDGQRWPRLWWCPSDLLSFLPLHAAGHHGTASDAVPHTVLDRVVCSTTPTLRALAHSRRGLDPTRPRADRAVVVAMPKTPGIDADLPGADAEAALVRRNFPGKVDVLSGTAATHDTVLAALDRARWAHFACHGHSDLADPSNSRMILADHHNRPLTVADLARLRMDDAELAFLSACSTARPGGRLADEVIHLASAFQLAGYRHVIGTLWPISDRYAVDVTDMIYSAIADGVDVAAAVHGATLRMRNRCPRDPSVWASHLHVGA